MTEKERIINCMSPLVAALDKADPEWAIFGSAALALCGMDMPVADIDIILSPEGAARMEQEWLKTGMALPLDQESAPESLFRSHLVRNNSTSIMVELSGGLEIRTEEGWMPVRPREVLTTPTGIRHCSLPECKRLLTLFGRPKDLHRLRLIEAHHTHCPLI